MKPNAPEKIYVVDATFPDYVDFDGSPINTKRIDDHDIEYTRTDAFIEKACEWLRRNLSNYFDATREDFELFIGDFRKYLKEE